MFINGLFTCAAQLMLSVRTEKNNYVKRHFKHHFKLKLLDAIWG
jgi:hypothetical protein